MAKKCGNRPKEYLYVGHYIDTHGNYILKIGTTNDLRKRKAQHEKSYREPRQKIGYRMADDSEFIYDWTLPLSKYNTLRFEDRNRERWKSEGFGRFISKDRFCCGKCKPDSVTVTIRKTYTIKL